MTQNTLIVRIAERISPDLALRNIVDAFFDWLERLPNKALTLDFAGVCSISRSFAHQYMLRKNISGKLINEMNLPDNVSKMLEIVRSSDKSEVLDLNSIRIMTV